MPVLYDETQERFGYSVEEAKAIQKVLIECDQCGAVVTRRKKHLHDNVNYCQGCIMKKVSKQGHAGLYKIKTDEKPVFRCKLCGKKIDYDLTYCDPCGQKVTARRIAMGDNFSGYTAPATAEPKETPAQTERQAA